jgi:hypothetical protein
VRLLPTKSNVCVKSFVVQKAANAFYLTTCANHASVVVILLKLSMTSNPQKFIKQLFWRCGTSQSEYLLTFLIY